MLKAITQRNGHVRIPPIPSEKIRRLASDERAGNGRTPALAVNDHAPRFTLPASTGESISLDDYLARGPVVLLWFVFDFGRV